RAIGRAAAAGACHGEERARGTTPRARTDDSRVSPATALEREAGAQACDARRQDLVQTIEGRARRARVAVQLGIGVERIEDLAGESDARAAEAHGLGETHVEVPQVLQTD